MSQNRSRPEYEVYRILPGLASPLAALFQKLDQSPNDPRAHFELGAAAQQIGASQLAVECYARVTQLAPGVEAGFFNLGNVLFEIDRFDEARQAYERALQLRRDAGTLINLGNSFASVGNWEKAVASFDQALSLEDCPVSQARTALSNKGKALIAAGNWNGALENYRHAVSRFPGDMEFVVAKANGHFFRFEFSKAAESLVEALAAAPQSPELLCRIADVNFCRGRTLESLLCLNRAFEMSHPPKAWKSRRLQVLTYCDPATPHRIFSEASDWATSIADTTQAKETNTLPRVTGGSPLSALQGLRVGILCSSLSSRGLGAWLPDCLPHDDEANIEWTIYCDQPADTETKNAMLRTRCRLEETAKLSDHDLVSLIQSHQVNLLIDMIGHGHSTRLHAVARKPALIQVSWLGFPMTSGLKQIDCLWSDGVAAPPEHEEFFSEKVIRFSASSLCFRPAYSIELTPSAHEPQRRRRAGFLGRPEQITDPWIDLAKSILNQLPDLELVFIGQEYRDPSFQAEIRERLGNSAATGPAATGPASTGPAVTGPDATGPRVYFECFESAVDELTAYQQLDVSLDPLLVNAPQRTFESLWMGVPVVTLLGDRFSGRCTASILESLHRREWIARDPAEFVAAVEQVVTQQQLSGPSRARLRSDLLDSPMCRAESIAQSIQNAIRETIHATTT